MPGGKDQGGGGILSAGNLTLDQVVVADNSAFTSTGNTNSGGGIAVWDGYARIENSWLDRNASDVGGAVSFCGDAMGEIIRSTISGSDGGGLHSRSTQDIAVRNSTFSLNIGGDGAIYSGRGFALDGDSFNVSMSADGRYTAFVSAASSLVANDFNSSPDVFLYDVIDDVIKRVGEFGGSPSISADGNSVAYIGTGSRLFVYDRLEDANTTIDLPLPDDPNRLADLSEPSINADGRFIAFHSTADYLVPNDDNEASDVFVVDLVDESIERISVNSLGLEGDGGSFDAQISANGRFVVFVSESTNLVADDDPSGFPDIFIYDRDEQLIERVPPPIENVALRGSLRPAISANGQVVAFQSSAFDSDLGFIAEGQGLFAFDRVEESTEIVDPSVHGASPAHAISGSGTFIAFFGANEEGDFDLFIHDRRNSLTERVPRDLEPGQQEIPARQILQGALAMNDDGSALAFATEANYLPGTEAKFLDVDGLEPGTQHVYVRDTDSGSIISPTRIMDFGEVVVEQTTIVETIGSRYAVQGAVQVEGSLFANNIVFEDIGPFPNVTSSVFSRDAGANRIGELSGTADFPPVHRLLRGNPAIDRGSDDSSGTLDQLGTVRETPDAGAVEAVTGSLSGTIFVDHNQNQIRDASEPGLDGVEILASDGSTGGFREVVVSGAGEDGIGRYVIDPLPVGDTQVQLTIPPRFSYSYPAGRMIQRGSIAPDGSSFTPSPSFDGSLVAFASDAGNLVDGDDVLGVDTDIFVFDSRDGTIERISASSTIGRPDGRSFSPAISGDGRSVAFVSYATNLHGFGPAVLPGTSNVFLADREIPSLTDDAFETIIFPISYSRLDDGFADGSSYAPALSGDGSVVAFASDATNLVEGDTNEARDIFVHDLNSFTLERISVDSFGNQANGDSGFVDDVDSGQSMVDRVSISADGRYVAFSSTADNLVEDDWNGVADVFIYDRMAQTIERVISAESDTEPNGASRSPVLSGDGQSLAFVSLADNLVADDSNFRDDVFVFDRGTKKIERLESSESIFGAASLSHDGRFVAFSDIQGEQLLYDRLASRLSSEPSPFVAFKGSFDEGISTPIVLSGNGRTFAHRFDDFLIDFVSGLAISSNQLIEPGVTRTIYAGDEIQNLDFGLVPDVGFISGTLFEDTVPNDAIDIGEPPLADWIVFVDDNNNGFRDDAEHSVSTNAEGFFRFDLLAGLRDYRLRVVVPDGFEQVTHQNDDQLSQAVFLPAGGHIQGRNFGFRRVSSTGQSTNSSVSGRVLDQDGNPLSGIAVYLDADNDKSHDLGSDEPIELTDDDGVYRFDALGARIVSVRTELNETVVHTDPLGNDFQITTTPLFDDLLGFRNPQAIEEGDFNNDGFEDLAVLISDRNSLAIRLNDRTGQFPPSDLEIELSPIPGVRAGVSQPRDLVVGQFNGPATGLDIAVVGFASNNVLVLKDFNGSDFDARESITVGKNPIDLRKGRFDADGDIDLVVVNRGRVNIVPGSDPIQYIKDNDESFQVLINDGDGSFIASPEIPVPGDNPNGIAVGKFSDDEFDDVVVLQPTPNRSDSPLGDVALFVNDGSAGFQLDANYYPVGANPTDITVGDFNDDGYDDLAVASADSTSITVLTGSAGGVLDVAAEDVGTTKGVDRMEVADINNDGRMDIVASRLDDTNVAIFRNSTRTIGGEVTFEPLESIGLTNLNVSERSPIALANFDNDISAPGDRGTVDIVALPKSSTEITVLKNTLINGGHRINLTGTNDIVGLDFQTRPAVLPPMMDSIDSPPPIVEDAGAQQILLTGIRKGRADGPELQFTATSSDPSIIPNPTITPTADPMQANLQFSSVLNAIGDAVIAVRVTDAGANRLFGDDDDGVLEESFEVTILPANDPPEMTIPNERSVLQTAGPQTISDFATGLNVGGGVDERDGVGAQTLLGFSIRTDDSFFVTPPRVDLVDDGSGPRGQLTFHPNPEKSGPVAVDVTLQDDGTSANGGMNSVTERFVIHLLPVNEPPAVMISDDHITVSAADGPQTRSAFAFGFQPGGGADESAQVVSDYVVTTDRPGLFTVLPDISNEGTLTFTPAPGRGGIANVNVQVRDSGGVENGGVDLSVPDEFTITVDPIPDTVAPFATFSTTTPDLTNQTLFEVSVSFGEPVAGFELDDIELSFGTASNLIDGGDGSYTFSYTATDDGPLTMSVRANAVTDLAGNSNVGSRALSLTIDSKTPEPLIVASESTPPGTFDLAITFDEEVIGLSNDDFAVSNAFVSSLEGNGVSYTATLTSINPGEVSVYLPDDRVSDAVGNRNATSNLVELTSAGPVTAIVLTGAGETVDMAQLESSLLTTVERIDIRGDGSNELILDRLRIEQFSPSQTLLVIADADDQMITDATWQFVGAEIVDRELQYVFENGPTTVRFQGPGGWTNPFDAFDVSGDGMRSSLDAIRVVNALKNPRVVDDEQRLVDPASTNLFGFQFYDVTQDGKLTPLDAIRIVNRLRLDEVSGEAPIWFDPSLAAATFVGSPIGGIDSEPMVAEESHHRSFDVAENGVQPWPIGKYSDERFKEEKADSSEPLDQALTTTWNWINESRNQ